VGLKGTPEQPFYEAVKQTSEPGDHTDFWMISCDEGWRTSIVCTDMYRWAADWLVNLIQGQPYAPDRDGNPRS
jgi:hypothetical protein